MHDMTPLIKYFLHTHTKCKTQHIATTLNHSDGEQRSSWALCCRALWNPTGLVDSGPRGNGLSRDFLTEPRSTAVWRKHTHTCPHTRIHFNWQQHSEQYKAFNEEYTSKYALFDEPQNKPTLLKLQSCTFIWLKMIQNQYLRKYTTSRCSKLSPYLSPIHNGYLIIMLSNLSATCRFSQEIRAWHCVITSRL